MQSENIIRKIDNLGRISIPKSLRDRFGLAAETEVEFLTEGRFICLCRKDGKEEKWQIAARALEELGLEVPKELKEKIC